MPGKLIANRFEINDLEKDLLGRGGMGEVYRATDTQTGETVAVKALVPDVLTNDPNLLERFVREGEALRQLNHPNIVHMIAAVEEGGRHYLVMEFVEGGSLRDLLDSRGSLSSIEVVKIALEIADALTRAHHLGIIHRDLKPGNVLLAKDVTTRLTDFGIAHIQDSSQLTQTGVLVGTVDYLSPEACRGEKLDERADIWSFGVMIFQMLTGSLPFKGESLTSKLTAILTQPVPDITQCAANIPDDLADLIYRMLEKDPHQRIPSVRLVGAELEAILKGRQAYTPSHPAPAESRFAIPTPVSNAQKHNLPIQSTPFIGREAELVELDRLLADPSVRLQSIVGVGGMGKTRLAIETGTRQLERFQHGVFFIALAGIQAVGDIVTATAQALGFSFYEGREPRQQLLDYLREKKILLIFDNFEHLLGGVGLVTDILHAANNVIALSTTRVRLGVPEEHIYQLSGMDFPAWETPADALEYSAVKLFLQSARRVRPGFELAKDDLKYIARICRLAGGMPLGILLAAAWLEMLTPAEIAAEMQNSLDFLAMDMPGVDERQRKIRAVLDYSWNSLTDRERITFRQLSVFRGGFTREAVQAVTGASLRDLMGLVNKSLLTRTSSGRYEIHEFLRQYGAERLSSSPEAEQVVRDHHCAYYAEFLHQREPNLHGTDQTVILSEVEAEIENIKIGWDWAVEHLQIKWLANYPECIFELYETRGWSREGARLFALAEQKLSNMKKDDPTTRLLRGKLMMWLGWMAEQFDTVETVDRLFQASLAIFRELDARRELAYALAHSGSNEETCNKSLSIFKELNDQEGIVLAMRSLGYVALKQENYRLAKQNFHDALILCRELDDKKNIGRCLSDLGYVCFRLGEYHEAEQHHDESLRLSKEVVFDRYGMASALNNLGRDVYGLKNYRQSQEYITASLELYKELGAVWGIALQLGDLAQVMLTIGDYARADQLAQETQAIYTSLSGKYESWPCRIIGGAAVGLGDYEKAKTYLHRALALDIEEKQSGHAMLTAIEIARLLGAQGKGETALEYLAFITSYRDNWQMGKDRAETILTELETRLPPEVVAVALERARSRDLETTLQELLADLAN